MSDRNVKILAFSEKGNGLETSNFSTIKEESYRDSQRVYPNATKVNLPRQKYAGLLNRTRRSILLVLGRESSEESPTIGGGFAVCSEY